MSECGGWCITVRTGDRVRLFMVANRDMETAKALALSQARAGEVFTCAEVSKQEIADLNMEADEVRESAEIGDADA